ncbi:MerR family transcriptional regulator [Streptomyces sp. H39-S7]|uniref:MerR family transcriptional regulator n=1 Tax=Streptomyces sp. H39-S7 TaxID=3004357 RepID=UPI0022AEEB40|nr:MerR family transcriptional regulator [Streptomyces sp. H39-S7]MCZ4125471.1 MerR family transcriptional regulator [Streptomyces sp. H39-S7]
MTSDSVLDTPPVAAPAEGAAVRAYLTPAQTVARSGFSLDTLRYYERIGLLGTVGRSHTGHRRFTPHDLEWLGVLRCLRDTGMPIAEMRRFAGLVRDGEGTFSARLALLEQHDAQVEERIAHLRRQQELVHDKIAFYRSVTAAPTPPGPAAEESAVPA